MAQVAAVLDSSGVTQPKAGPFFLFMALARAASQRRGREVVWLVARLANLSSLFFTAYGGACTQGECCGQDFSKCPACGNRALLLGLQHFVAVQLYIPHCTYLQLLPASVAIHPAHLWPRQWPLHTVSAIWLQYNHLDDLPAALAQVKADADAFNDCHTVHVHGLQGPRRLCAFYFQQRFEVSQLTCRFWGSTNNQQAYRQSTGPTGRPWARASTMDCFGENTTNFDSYQNTAKTRL